MVKFTLLLAFVGLAAAAPFKLNNGFPNPSPSAIAQIEKEAGGTLPNTPLPTSLKANAVQSLQVIAVNEIFEAAYFSSLLHNVTHNVDGYTDFDGLSRDYVIKSLTQIRAQEEMHALGANAILKSAGAKTIGSCNYMFPVTDFKSAITLAATFTDLVLGTLQNVNQGFALDGGQAAEGLVPLLDSIIGQEGEQDGAYRLIQRKVPSAAPFLTAAAGQFAFNAVDQLFIVPNSCPSSSNVSAIGIPAFKTLTLATSSEKPCSTKDTTLTFKTSESSVNGKHIAYISGQNKPVVVPVESVNGMEFKASFPFTKGFSKGLTVAALVNSAGPFMNAAEVANSTVAGPGLIEVD
ncbi:putative sexual development protein [Meira miltonrushii]|uniref:Putative sexual development protein n=1 Tax=Meira miltonrushii TaxID=1280837 RepID=A0A316VFC8_9BASI|nr:putative sexual development protein [Meira miltonrushii]PWN36337.1 putative sexual development protein [Meira miltonrushii]